MDAVRQSAELRTRVLLENTLSQLSPDEPHPTPQVRTAWARALARFFRTNMPNNQATLQLIMLQQQQLEQVHDFYRQQLRQMRRHSLDMERQAAELRAAAALQRAPLSAQQVQRQARELRGRLASDEAAQLARRHAEIEAAPSRDLRERVETARRNLMAEHAELQALRRVCACGQPARYVAVPCGHFGCELHKEGLLCPRCGLAATWNDLFPRF